MQQPMEGRWSIGTNGGPKNRTDARDWDERRLPDHSAEITDIGYDCTALANIGNDERPGVTAHFAFSIRLEDVVAKSNPISNLESSTVERT